jgi:P27 family predicted phage terminase small subunit
MKSKEEHKNNGTFRADRHEGKVDIDGIDRIPKAPEQLNADEAAIFDDIASKMFKQDSLSDLDLNALEVYCVQLNLFRKAKSELDRTGEYVTEHTNKAGKTNLVPSPWLMVLKTAGDQLLKQSTKLGLTPVDRSKANKVGRRKKEESLLR